MTAALYAPALVGTIVQVPPGDLVLERNIRSAKVDPALVASVKDVGVLEPITAVVAEGRRLVVRYGHRRTLAAVEAGRATVPVYVVGEDDLDAAAEVDRIIRQHDENTLRDDLTAADQVGVVEQLTMFGLSATQIAKRARIDRPSVDAAIATTGSELARKAVARYEALTLDQAAAVAEFEDDPETAKALIVTAIDQPAGFAHTLQRKRDDRDRDVKKAAAVEALTAAGVTLVDHPNYDAATKRLSDLVAANTGEDIDAEAHATCPGHVAWLGVEWVEVNLDGSPITVEQAAAHDDWEDKLVGLDAQEWADGQEGDDAYQAAVDALGPDPSGPTHSVQEYVPVFGCSNPGKHGHRGRYGSTTTRTPVADMSDAERERAAKDRRLVIENNKAWASAQTVRRGALKVYAASKTPPKGTGAFIAQALTTNAMALVDYKLGDLAIEWLGIKQKSSAGRRHDIADAATRATDGRALMIALLVVLAAYETQLTKDAWRADGKQSNAGHYLRFLESAFGYNLSEVEQYAVSSKTV